MLTAYCLLLTSASAAAAGQDTRETHPTGSAFIKSQAQNRKE